MLSILFVSGSVSFSILVFAENRTETDQIEESIEKEQEIITSSEPNNKDSSLTNNSDNQEVNNSNNEISNDSKVLSEAEDIEISIKGNTAIVQLSNEPKSNDVVVKIRDSLVSNPNVSKLIVNGKFGRDNNNAMGAVLSDTNILELELQNSNYIPNMFYSSGSGNKSKLKSYKDDGTVTEMGYSSFVLMGKSNYNQLKSFNSPSLKKVENGAFEGFKGEALILPELISVYIESTSNNANNFFDMPNIRMIDLPALTELTGYNLFSGMPNLTSLNLSHINKMNTGRLLDNENKYPTYVDLSNLTILAEDSEVGSKSSENPVYIKVGKNHPSKLNNKETNAIFYQSLSPKTNYDVEKGDELKISSIGEQSFLSYNLNDVKITWYIDDKLSEYVGTEIKIDTNKLSKGKHTFKPVISYKGKEESSFFEKINIDVNVKVADNRPVTATAVPQVYSLGRALNYLEAKDLIKDTKIDSESVGADSYTLKIKHMPDSNVIGKKEIVITITRKANGVENDIKVPLEINWGNSIKLNGTYYQTIMGLTTHKSGSGYALIATRGENKKNNPLIHQSIKDEYINIGVINTEENRLDKLKPHYEFSKKGSDKVEEAYESFKRQEMKIGDIIQVKHKESVGDAKFVEVANENILTFPTKGFLDKRSYFEIDYDGRFQPIHINQLTGKESTIFIGTDHEYLDKNIQEFIDLNGYNNIKIQKFSSYPTTDKMGNSKGTIIVEEKLKSGKKIQWEYEVNFIVKDKIKASPKKQTLNLGGDFNEISPYELVQDVKLGDKSLTKEEYTVSLENTVPMDTVGDKTAKVLVTYKKDLNNVLSLDVPVKILWGNTIVSKDLSYDTIVSSVTVLNDANQPKLYANKGNGLSQLLYLNARPTLRIYDTDLMNPLSVVSYGTVQQTPENLLNTWQEQFNTINKTLKYGDVLSFTVFKYGSSKNNYNGENTWISRNNELVKESKGYDMAYYEIIQNDLKLLHINQLSVINSNLPLHTSKEYLDEHISEYIDLKGYSNIEVKKFSSYPTTSNSGETSGKIVVEETLESGKKVQWEYEVDFIVDNKWVNVTVPTKMLFSSDMKSEKKDKIISESYSITNNSSNTLLEVELASFSVEEDSEVTYLSAVDENPTNPENKLRLNLFVNGQSKVQSLNSETKAINLIDLDVKTSAKLSFEGQYFNADSEDSRKAKSSMVLKFNIKR